MENDNNALPTYAEFKGETVSDLIAFLSAYPGEMKACFLSDDVFVARVKGDTLFLRLDPEEDRAGG